MTEQILHKQPVLDSVSGQGKSVIRKYQEFFIGDSRFLRLIQYELASMLAGPMPGSIGYLLRKLILPRLFKSIGSGVQWGRNISLRHPGKITIGSNTAIDDYCLLDARSLEQGEFRIGKHVLVARGCLIQSKADRGFVEIGDNSVVSTHCILNSTGGIRIGNTVGIGSDCFIGGGMYRTTDPNIPIIKQTLYSVGPVVIEDDCWIGAGSIILDGVTIGKGSVIGAGAVVRQDISPFTTVNPYHKLVMLPREGKSPDTQGEAGS